MEGDQAADTSDECMTESLNENVSHDANELIEQLLISERWMMGSQGGQGVVKETGTTSSNNTEWRQLPPLPPVVKSPEEERAHRVIREAEQAKARIMDMPGRVQSGHLDGGLSHSVVLDEDYMLVASHLDSAIKEKIVNHEYVDFSKLLRRDRAAQD